jgi:hypothetical protein
LYVPPWIAALGLAASLFGATLAAASLAAFAVLSRARLRHLADDGIAPAKRLLRLAERPGPTLAALAAADLAFTIAALGCALALGRAPDAPAEALVLGFVVVLLLLGHAIAWAVAADRPKGWGWRWRE